MPHTHIATFRGQSQLASVTDMLHIHSDTEWSHCHTHIQIEKGEQKRVYALQLTVNSYIPTFSG